jgi:hypothetical protein
MPLTDEQKSAIASLKDVLKDLPDEDVEEAAVAIRGAALPVWDHIHDTGHQKATAGSTRTMTKLTRDLQAAQNRVKQLEDAQSEGGTPDQVKALNDARAEITRLSKALTDKDKEVEQRDEERERERVVGKLLGELEKAEGHGRVRPAWRKLIAQDAELRARIKPKKGDESFTILQHGKSIPISADDDTEDAMVAALAKEIKGKLKKEDPDALAVDVDAGAGVRSGEQGGTGGDGYDPVAEGKRMAAVQKNQGESLKNLAMR